MNSSHHASHLDLADQRGRLAQWLAEREIDLALCESDDAAGVAPSFSTAQYPRLEKPRVSPMPGEVYILKPSAEACQNTGPVHVLILDARGERGCLAAPFGRYATPAVPGEWNTRLKAAPLRVLCLWNARRIDPACLLPGHAYRLSRAKLQQALAVHLHVHQAVPLAAPLARDLGPPLVHPADPRHAYLDEERRRLDVFFPSPRVVRERTDRTGLYERADSFDDGASWRLAAEGGEVYLIDKTKEERSSKDPPDKRKDTDR